LTICIRGKS